MKTSNKLLLIPLLLVILTIILFMIVANYNLEKKPLDNKVQVEELYESEDSSEFHSSEKEETDNVGTRTSFKVQRNEDINMKKLTIYSPDIENKPELKEVIIELKKPHELIVSLKRKYKFSYINGSATYVNEAYTYENFDNLDFKFDKGVMYIRLIEGNDTINLIEKEL